jgi:hypothetical protein
MFNESYELIDRCKKEVEKKMPPQVGTAPDSSTKCIYTAH